MVFLSTPLAQEPVPSQGDVAELAARLDRVHLGDSDADISSFSATLQLNTLATDQDAISITLITDFAKFQVGERIRRYIGYRVQEEGKLVERGFCEQGYWTRIDNEVVYLTAARHQADVESVKRDVRLARQLLEYLDPGSVVRRMRDVQKLETRVLEQGRRAGIRCTVVRGTMDAFPLYYLGGEVGRAFLDLWVEEESGRLIAAEATPMTEEGKPDEEHREFLRLDDPKTEPKTGILLPGALKIFTVDQAGVRQPQVEVGLRSIDLAPGLEPKDFLPESQRRVSQRRLK